MPKGVYWCHCQSCRRHTGAPVSAYAGFEAAKVRFTQGTLTYFSSSPGVRRGFCAKCGSPLTYENEQVPDEVHVLAGALDEPNLARPTAHVFTEDQLAWFDSADQLPRYAKTRRDGPPLRHGPRQ